MTIRVAINGYGRIGRNILRALYERQDTTTSNVSGIKIVAVNDLGDPAINAHLTRFDTTHGPFKYDVIAHGDALVINDDKISIFSERNPELLPWKELDIDIVFECTGFFTERSLAAKHIEAGAKKVLISAPSKNADATIVYGVNHNDLNSSFEIVSNASCTTNCLAPMAKMMHSNFKIESGLMTTIHAVTNDQKLTDVYHSDPYRARSAMQSMIPTKTGAAEAVGLVIPELSGILDGLSVRVPTINVSLVDLSMVVSRNTSKGEVNEILKQETNKLEIKIIECNELPLVSQDFNHNPASCIIDLAQTRVTGNLVKLMAWYDNEWGFSNRMLDTSLVWMESS